MADYAALNKRIDTIIRLMDMRLERSLSTRMLAREIERRLALKPVLRKIRRQVRRQTCKVSHV